jgi:hypothetical protein
MERFACFLAAGSDSVGRGESVWSGGVVPGVVVVATLRDGALPREPMDMKRRSLVGFCEARGVVECSWAVSRAGLLSLAPSKFIAAA